jgi:hypothetical protein
MKHPATMFAAACAWIFDVLISILGSATSIKICDANTIEIPM